MTASSVLVAMQLYLENIAVMFAIVSSTEIKNSEVTRLSKIPTIIFLNVSNDDKVDPVIEQTDENIVDINVLSGVSKIYNNCCGNGVALIALMVLK